MSRKYGLYAGLLTVVTLVSLFLFTPYTANAKDTLMIGIQVNVASLDPAKAYETVSMGMTRFLLYETLVNFKEDDFTQIVPELAESWDVSADGRTWTFHIRKGVSFASGNPVNAESVVFSLRRVLKIAGEPSWMLTQFGITEASVTEIDADTVQIVLDQPYAPLLFLSCLAYHVASILDQEVVMEHEQAGDMGSAWLEEHSAGSGAFNLEQYKPGESYTLTAKKNYWRERPAVNQIIMKNVEDPFEQVILLEKGEIDIAWNLGPSQMRRLETNPDVQLFEIPTLYTHYVMMSLGHEPFTKSEVRKAIHYAIDYDGITEYVLEGAAEKIQTFIPKGLLGYNPAMPYDYDPEKTKELLRESGYPDGFESELACLNYSPWTDVALKIKSDLAKVGITVKINQMEASQLMEILLSSREYQMLLWEWFPDYIDPDNNAKAYAHSDSAGDDATIKLLAWSAKYVNLETSKLVDQAAREADSMKREALYKKITDMMLEDGPFVMLYVSKHQYGIRLDVRELVGIPSLLQSKFPVLR